MIDDSMHLLFADDDKDDCFLFKVALEELSIPSQITIVYDGEQLMELLHEEIEQLPDMLFLDLNMPRKNGFQCLAEIKQNEKLKHLPVIIYSTSYQPEVAKLLFGAGAHYYIHKPTDFELLKKVIQLTISLVNGNGCIQPTEDHFLLSHESL